MNSRRLMLPLLIGLSLSLGACAASPEQLAKDLQKAFEGGDMDAALELAKFDEAPAQLHFFYLNQVSECAGADTICTVSIQPLDADYNAKLAEQAKVGVEAAVAPIGVVLIESKDKDGKGSGKLRMPYAEVDGRYVVLAQRYSKAKVDELRAITNESLLLDALAEGTRDSNGQPRPDWKATATELPAGGGEAGAAFVQRAAALVAAAKAGDPEAAAKIDGTQPGGWYADKDWNSKPLDLATRRHKLRAHSVRFLHDIEVTGGWQGEDTAILVANAKDGVGWIERGAFVVTKTDDVWDYRGRRFTVSYPTD